MLPAILPNSVLTLRRASGAACAPGDIVCFPSPSLEVVAHRVVRLRTADAGAVGLVVRGDAQTREEVVLRDEAFWEGEVVPALGHFCASLMRFIALPTATKGQWLSSDEKSRASFLRSAEIATVAPNVSE